MSEVKSKYGWTTIHNEIQVRYESQDWWLRFPDVDCVSGPFSSRGELINKLTKLGYIVPVELDDVLAELEILYSQSSREKDNA
jgi:hypothetical protein